MSIEDRTKNLSYEETKILFENTKKNLENEFEKILNIKKNNENKIKIGILIDNKLLKNIYSNGIGLNVILIYNILKEFNNFDVFFLLNNSYLEEYNKIFEDLNYKYKTFDFNNIKLNDLNFNIIISISTYNYDLLKLLKNNMKIIYINLGNRLENFIHNFTLNKTNDIIYNDFSYDEVWITPQFEYSKFYYEIFWKTEIKIFPYLWGDFLIKNNNIVNNNDYNFDELRIGIIEPNLNQKKNCIIPICICELAKDFINQVYVFNSEDKKNNKSFVDFISKTTLFKDNKISFESRHKFLDILEKYCNCIVSFTENWDLNYIHLECFYLGIPIIHNSKMLKDYGYYYPDYDVKTASNQIKFILKYHNKDEYILKNKKILEKYSIDNILNKNKIFDLINNIKLFV